jgi:hypothetical protein
MKKVSIIIPHFKTWKWTAICIHQFKKFGIPVDSEIIICDNSPDHPSIKAITSTSLGEGVKVVEGERDFPSHGRGYEVAMRHTTGDHIFCSETDSFPIRSGWFDEYIKASSEYDFIGPEIPQSSGRYLHPAGALIKMSVIEAAREWQSRHKEWLFIPDAGIKLEVSDKCYHVVTNRKFLGPLVNEPQIKRDIELWSRADVFQEMRSFDEDSFSTYSQRTGITNWEPVKGKQSYLKIGYESGQWLAYYAQSHGFKCLAAPTELKWMAGHHGGQAAYSDVFGGFRHVWCGTSSFCDGIAPDVKAFKIAQMEAHWSSLPESLRVSIEKLEHDSV